MKLPICVTGRGAFLNIRPNCCITFPVHDVLRPKAYKKIMRSIFAQMRRMCPDFFVLEKNLDRGASMRATKLVPGVIRSF